MELLKKILASILCVLLVLTCVACSDSKKDKDDDDDDNDATSINEGDPNCQHTYGEWELTKEPTCILTGTRKHTCTLCGKEESEKLNYKGHLMSDGKCKNCGKAANTTCKHAKTEINSVSKATCTKDGANYEICTSCKEVIEVIVLYSKGHDNEYFSYQDATCTEDGWYSYYECSRCGENNKEVIEATGHSFIAGTCTVCEAVNENFELIEPEQNTGNEYNRPVSEAVSFANANAEITTTSGEIKNEDQVDTYTFVAQNQGRYCIWISELYSGNVLQIYVLNRLGETIVSNTYCENNEGLYTDNLVVGETYTIEVRQYRNTGTYNISVAMPKPAIDVTEYDCVSDSIEYEDQVNIYTFAPTITGVYRFEFAEMLADTDIDLYIFNHLGETVHSLTYLNNGEGINGTFEAGETYQIKVIQRNKLSPYRLNIYKQRAALSISEYTKVNDKITFPSEELNYFFTAPTDGTFNFGLTGMSDEINVDVYILNSLGETVTYGSWLENGESLSLSNAKAGEEYVIRVKHRYELGAFTLNINLPGKAIDINSDMGVKGSLVYSDQTNIYNFVADKDGDHTIAISGMTSGAYVYVGVYDTNGNEIDYEYCYNNDTIKLEGLKSGDAYTIKVIQDYKLTDYIISVQ